MDQTSWTTKVYIPQWCPLKQFSLFHLSSSPQVYVPAIHIYTVLMAIHSRIQVQPLSTAPLGTEVLNADLANLTPTDFEVIRTALYTHHVLLFKNQSSLIPKAQYELTRLFDPKFQFYGHGKTVAGTKKSVLHPDLKTIPHQPQVQVIGNGPVAEFEGLKDITLKHPHHRMFHLSQVSEEEDRDVTRFYRWHIDAALYDLNPPRVTTLMAVQVPKSEYQTLRYDDRSGDRIGVSRGSTAFVSSERMYDILSDEDKEFVRGTKVQYAPHPYVWMSRARSREDGLGMVSEGRELSRSDLLSVDEEKVQILPMCWRNPVTGKLGLQVHPSAVEKLHLADGTVMEDVTEVREIVHRLQRPGIAPGYVYAVDVS